MGMGKGFGKEWVTDKEGDVEEMGNGCGCGREGGGDGIGMGKG